MHKFVFTFLAPFIKIPLGNLQLAMNHQKARPSNERCWHSSMAVDNDVLRQLFRNGSFSVVCLHSTPLEVIWARQK